MSGIFSLCTSNLILLSILLTLSLIVSIITLLSLLNFSLILYLTPLSVAVLFFCLYASSKVFLTFSSCLASLLPAVATLQRYLISSKIFLNNVGCSVDNLFMNSGSLKRYSPTNSATSSFSILASSTPS